MTTCCDGKHIEVREASETEARRNWARDFVEGGKRDSEARATIARLESELAEAKRPRERSRMLILAARSFADEHRVLPSEPVDVECSFVDWFRSELIGASCVLPKSNVVLSPHEALCEGELRVKP